MYLRELIEKHKLNGEWKVQLIAEINFKTFKIFKNFKIFKTWF